MTQPYLAAFAAAAALATATSAHAQAGGPVGEPAFDSTFFAWERGDYPDALARLERLLGEPGGERLLTAAAELTGEVFTTVELTTDGRGVRWSPDSRHVAYEQGSGAQRRTHVVAMDGGVPREVAMVPGVGLVFDGRGAAVYVAGSPAGVVVRDLATGAERRLNTTGLNVQALTTGRADHTVYALAPAGGGASQLYALSDAAPRQVTRGAGTKTAPAVLADGAVVYGVDRTTFAVERPDGGVRQFAATGWNVSPDGSGVVYAWQDGADHVITLLPGGSTEGPEVVRSSDALASPALSLDGRRVTYQRMLREDWEVFVAHVDGSDERRLTREIQHDVLPRFVNDSVVMAVMGEPRHRRSYLYHAVTGARMRLFHNNTVRTVAPEYEWELSPDGTRLAIVAERDGDTVSPERGVYVMDLTRPVTLAEVQARVRRQLAAERDLRLRGARLFADSEDRVRDAVAAVSKDRVYRYSYDLYQFDSKFITRPGNQRAIEYLAEQLRQWGYEPEIQWFETRPRAAPGTPQPEPVRTANVIAKLPGTVHPDVLYVVSSHFDSVERGPGADDNTSGTAALLEAARVLATRPQAATIHFAFFTGEESGLLGSREYVRRAVERGDKLVGALNNDMIGFANDQRLDNTIRYSNDGIRDIQHAAAFLFTDLITYDAKYYRSTDAHAYYEAYGDIVGGIGSYPILGNPHYHQTHDQLETINHQLVAEVSRTTIATLMHLASVPSRPKNVVAIQRGNRTEVSWDALPEQDIREYLVEWGPAGGAARGTVRVAEPRAVLPQLSPDDEVRVSAVNDHGAMAWAWARAMPQTGQ